MIVIIDYGMGNIGSILNMLTRLGHPAVISNDLNIIKSASHLILPGVGAFDTGMNHLHGLNLLDSLNQKVLLEKTPILGICIGMQLMAQFSEEGQEKGLGWLTGEVKKFNFENTAQQLRVPCVGWNNVKPKKNNPLLMEEFQKFYFVHSYHYQTAKTEEIIGTAQYGYEYPVMIRQENIFGVQFHPEKSHQFGLKLFENFIALSP
jgi:imidazole glycerol-phosphate synthase subunit HisH